MTTKQLTEDLYQFANELVAHGFRVWYNPNTTYNQVTYLYAAIDGKLGTVQRGLGVGYSYSTMHKPTAVFGTGFAFGNGSLSVETMCKCCYTLAPDWWRGSTNGIVKWNLNEWLKANPQLMEVTSSAIELGAATK